MDCMNQKLIDLRRELHKYPEISNKEFKTTERIIRFISEYNPDEIIRLGETGVLFVFKGKGEGKTKIGRAHV